MNTNTTTLLKQLATELHKYDDSHPLLLEVDKHIPISATIEIPKCLAQRILAELDGSRENTWEELHVMCKELKQIINT